MADGIYALSLFYYKLEAIWTKKLRPSAQAVEGSVFQLESRVADETHQSAVLAFAKEVAEAYRDTLAYVDAKYID